MRKIFLLLSVVFCTFFQSSVGFGKTLLYPPLSSEESGKILDITGLSGPVDMDSLANKNFTSVIIEKSGNIISGDSYALTSSRLLKTIINNGGIANKGTITTVGAIVLDAQATGSSIINTGIIGSNEHSTFGIMAAGTQILVTNTTQKAHIEGKTSAIIADSIQLKNSGVISNNANKPTIQLKTSSTITNSGFITNLYGTQAIMFGEGENTLTLKKGSVISGSIHGCSHWADGKDSSCKSSSTNTTVILKNNGSVADSMYGIQTLIVQAKGNWFIGNVTLDNGGSVDTGHLIVNGTLKIKNKKKELIISKGAYLSGIGIIDGHILNNGGTIEPGYNARVGQLTFVHGSDYQDSPGSVLLIRVSGPATLSQNKNKNNNSKSERDQCCTNSHTFHAPLPHSDSLDSSAPLSSSLRFQDGNGNLANTRIMFSFVSQKISSNASGLFDAKNIYPIAYGIETLGETLGGISFSSSNQHNHNNGQFAYTFFSAPSLEKDSQKNIHMTLKLKNPTLPFVVDNLTDAQRGIGYVLSNFYNIVKNDDFANQADIDYLNTLLMNPNDQKDDLYNLLNGEIYANLVSNAISVMQKQESIPTRMKITKFPNPTVWLLAQMRKIRYSQSQVHGSSAFSFLADSLKAGMQWPISRAFNIGVLGVISTGKTANHQAQSSSHSQIYQVSTNASYFFLKKPMKRMHMYVASSLHYMHYSAHVKRTPSYLDVNYTLKSSPVLSGISLFGEVGCEKELFLTKTFPLIFSPFVRAGVTRVTFSLASETGPERYSLVVHKKKFTIPVVTIGGSLKQSFSLASFKKPLSIEGSLSLSHNFDSKNISLSQNILKQDVSNTIYSAPLSSYVLSVGAHFVIPISSSVTLRIGYNGSFGKGQTDNSVNFSAQYYWL